VGCLTKKGLGPALLAANSSAWPWPVLRKAPLAVSDDYQRADAPAEEALYQRLQALVAVENGAMVSIAHRPGVAAFHHSYVEMGAPR
jgi:hypothetical protein